MSEKEFNEIFSKRLRYYLDINGMSQLDLAKKLGVGTTSVSNWVNGIKTPRMSKVDAMCTIFSCNRSDLITECPVITDSDDVMRLFLKLTPDNKHKAISYIEYLISEQAKEKNTTDQVI